METRSLQDPDMMYVVYLENQNKAYASIIIWMGLFRSILFVKWILNLTKSYCQYCVKRSTDDKP